MHHYSKRRDPLELALAFIYLTFLILFAALLFTEPARAADSIPGPGSAAPAPGDVTVVTGITLAQALAAFVINLVGYSLNYFGPQVSQQVKGTVLLVLNLAFGVVLQAINNGTFGWNAQTGVMLLSSFVATLLAHGVLSTTGIAQAFGAGRNRPGQPPANVQRYLIGDRRHRA